jgi:hypothetical protein
MLETICTLERYLRKQSRIYVANETVNDLELVNDLETVNDLEPWYGPAQK